MMLFRVYDAKLLPNKGEETTKHDDNQDSVNNIKDD